jgi:serine/threonine protein kinase/WD40 repeat protein
MPTVDTSSCSDRDPIEWMAESFLEQYRRGERPSIEEFAAQHPELAEDIRELLPALVQLEQDMSMSAPGATGSLPGEARATSLTGAPRTLGDYTILREVGRGGMGVVYEAVQRSLGRHVALKVLPWHQIGDSPQLQRFQMEARSAARLHHTNIVPVFGVGEDQGVNYYAMQFIRGHGLDTIIAELRRLRHGGATPPAVGGPSGTETAAVAATVADVVARGLLTGRFASMPPGGAAGDTGAGTPGPVTLTTAASESPSTDAGAPAPPEAAMNRSELAGLSQRQYYHQVARVGLQVAEALEYAHAQGILHRDIKPANLLMDTFGTVWVADFGLAKAEGSDGPTRTGDIVGTLRYLAPERLEGRADRRSDVYALGATLYELLTLQPVFGEASRPRLLERILHDQPAPPRALDRLVPRDLETILLKALAKEPERRYLDAGAMAADLRRVLEDQPIQARRVGPAERAWRWCRRNPAVAGLTGLAATLLVLVAAVASVGYARTSAALAREGRALSNQKVALASERAARREAVGTLYHSLVGEVRALRIAREVGYRGAVLDRLGRANRLDTPERDRAEMRREAVASLGDFVGLEPRTLGGFNSTAVGIAVHPRSESIAVGFGDGTIRLYDRATGAERWRLGGPRPAPAVGAIGRQPPQVNVATALNFDPTGHCLLVGSYLGRVQVIMEDLAAGAPRVTNLPRAEGVVLGFAATTDGRLLVICGAPDRPAFSIHDLGGDQEGVSRFDLGNGFRDVVWGQFQKYCQYPIALSPDGRRVAAVIEGQTPSDRNVAYRLVLWEVATRRVLKVVSTPFPGCYGIAFSPDGARLAIAQDGGFAVFDAADLSPRQFVRLDSATSIEFHPEGRALAVATLSGLVQLWSPETNRMLAELKHPQAGGVRKLTLSRDGRTLVSMGYQSVRVWDLAGASERIELAGHVGGVPGLAFGPDGAILASSGKDQTVKLWDPSTGTLVKTLDGLPDVMQPCAFIQDGTTLVAGSYYRGFLRAWDTKHWTVVEEADGKTRQANGPIYGMDTARGTRGEYLATSGMRLQVWRVGRADRGALVWEPVAEHVSPGSQDVALSPDASLVAHVEGGTAIRVRDLAKDRPLPYSGPSLMFGWHALAFRSDRELVFIAGDGTAVVWDVVANRLVRTIGAPGQFEAYHSAVSGDGRWLAAQDTPTAVAVVDLQRGEIAFTFREERSPIWSLAWSPDARRLAVGLSDGGLVVWDLERVRTQLKAIGLGKE